MIWRQCWSSPQFWNIPAWFYLLSFFCSFLTIIDKHESLKYEILPRLMNFVCCYVPGILCLIAFGFSSSKRLFLPFTSPCSFPTESSDSIVLHVQSNVVIFSFAHASFHILPTFLHSILKSCISIISGLFLLVYYLCMDHFLSFLHLPHNFWQCERQSMR